MNFVSFFTFPKANIAYWGLLKIRFIRYHACMKIQEINSLHSVTLLRLGKESMLALLSHYVMLNSCDSCSKVIIRGCHNSCSDNSCCLPLLCRVPTGRPTGHHAAITALRPRLVPCYAYLTPAGALSPYHIISKGTLFMSLIVLPPRRWFFDPSSVSLQKEVIKCAICPP